MAPPKKITGYVKLQIEAGKATPAPPVGPALGQAQVNIMEFCKQFNARTQTKEMAGLTIPVVITVYGDRSFTFVTKTPPASNLLLRAAGVAKGAGAPNKDKVGKVTEKQVREIAETKMPDLNAASVEAAIKSIKGTARRVGTSSGYYASIVEYSTVTPPRIRPVLVVGLSMTTFDAETHPQNPLDCRSRTACTGSGYLSSLQGSA